MNPAHYIIEAAKRNEFISGKLPVVPELTDIEKPFLSMIAGEIRLHVESKGAASLELDEIRGLFHYVVAKGCEVVYHWHCGETFTPDADGMFDGVPFMDVDSEMVEHFAGMGLPEGLFQAFEDWTRAYPDYCAENGAHPIIPLLEALKWTYRITLGLGTDFFGYDDSQERAES